MSGAHSLAIKADLDNLGQVRDFIESNLETCGLPKDSAGELLLAVDEAVSNIIMHGFKSAVDGDIELEVKQQPEALLVHIRDNAPLFDPTRDSNPHLEISPLERNAPGGFGIYLLNHLVDKIAYRVTDDGRNELTMLKKSGPKSQD
jgi:anti-sigma regulatory factor (Ser/Thr protein kinase)